MSFSIPFSPTVPTETLVKGNWYPQLQLQRLKFDPLRGFVYDYEWDGANQTLMLPVLQDCIDSGMAATCTFAKDKASLQVTDSTSEYTIDSWEIRANELSQDLFHHPTIVQSVGNDVGYGEAFTDVFLDIRTAIGLQTSLEDLIEGPSFTDLSYESIQLISDFYTLYAQGTTNYVRQQYVLQHKTNVSNRWGDNIDDYGIDQIYTPSQLLIEVSDPDLWVFPLPGRLQFKLAAIPPIPATGSPPPNFLWGWLKAGSTETTDAWNRVNIETSYTLELWNSQIYVPYAG